MNKKIMILIVIAECVLAVFLIGVIGLAIESTYSGVACRDVYFVNEEGVRLTEDDSLMVEHPDWGYQLHYVLDPENTTDVPVTFTSSKEDEVLINENGYVTFLDERGTDVRITISTKNGKTATIKLVPKRNTHGNVDLD